MRPSYLEFAIDSSPLNFARTSFPAFHRRKNSKNRSKSLVKEFTLKIVIWNSECKSCLKRDILQFKIKPRILIWCPIRASIWAQLKNYSSIFSFESLKKISRVKITWDCPLVYLKRISLRMSIHEIGGLQEQWFLKFIIAILPDGWFWRFCIFFFHSMRLHNA